MKLKVIEISKINLGDRFREDYGDLDRLAQSIKEKGLICPIAVIQESESENYTLAAGGRRLAAHKLLKLTSIPCRIYDKPLSNLELHAIELEENIRRKDLSPIEEVKLKAEILKLQQKIHGEKTSTTPNASGVSLRNVAEIIGQDHSTLSKDIALSNFIDQFPEVPWDDMKSKSEAFKMKNKIEEKLIRAELAKRAEAVSGKSGSSVFIKKLINSYFIKDFFKGVKDIIDGSINLVEIDPPYAINLKSIKKEYAYSHEKYNEISSNEYPKFLERLFFETYRVMSENSWMICWFAPEPWFETVYQTILKAGFACSRMCGIWVKSSGQSLSPSKSLANAYEMFFYARKGNPILARPGQLNTFHYNPVSQKVHPTERPLELMEDILTTFTTENSRILVPFAGSGKTLVAAAKNKMIPLGFDITEGYRNSYILEVQKQFKDMK